MNMIPMARPRIADNPACRQHGGNQADDRTCGGHADARDKQDSIIGANARDDIACDENAQGEDEDGFPFEARC